MSKTKKNPNFKLIKHIHITQPRQIICDEYSKQLIVCDGSNCNIIRFSPAKNALHKTVLLGCGYVSQTGDQNLISMQLHSPSSFAFAPPNVIYVCESKLHCIKRFDLDNETSEVVVGNGTEAPLRANLAINQDALSCSLRNPYWISMNDTHSLMAICDFGTCRILIYSPLKAKILTSCRLDCQPRAVEFLSSYYNSSGKYSSLSNTLFVSTSCGVERYHLTLTNGLVTAGTFEEFVSSFTSSDLKISEQIELLCGNRSTWGHIDGPKYDALFAGVSGTLANSSHSKLYISDYWNNRIRILDFQSDHVSTLAKNGDSIMKLEPNNTQAQEMEVDANKNECHFHYPNAITWYKSDETIAICHYGYNMGGCISVLSNVQGNSGDDDLQRTQTLYNMSQRTNFQIIQTLIT